MKFRRKMDSRFMYYLYGAFVLGFATNILIYTVSSIDYSPKPNKAKIRIYRGVK